MLEESGEEGRVIMLNLKMPNGLIVTIPMKGDVKVGLLRSAINKAGLTEEEFLGLL